MKRIKDSHIGLLVGVAGIGFFSYVFLISKNENQTLNKADHAIDPKIVAAALSKVHADNGVHPLADRYFAPGDFPRPLPKFRMMRLPGLGKNTNAQAAGTPSMLATSRIESGSAQANGETDKNLLRARESLERAIKAVDNARSQLRTAVASRSQFAPHS